MSEPTNDTPAVPRTWSEFRSSGMLWWANRVLHVFGWAIVLNIDDDTGEVLGAEPRRTVWRGFPPESEAHGHERVTAWMQANADQLMSETMLDDEAAP